MKRDRVLLGLLVAIGLMLVPGVGEAATYYVAKNGDDSYSCTQAQVESTPKLTITSALNCLGTGLGAGAGHMVIVKAGTYAEYFISTIPGGTSWSSPFWLAANPGDTVVIQPISATSVMYFSRAASQYIIVDGFILDGSNLSRASFYISDPAHHIRLTNTEIRNSYHSAITTSPGSRTGAGNYNEFINLTIHDFGSGNPRYDHGFYINTAYNLIQHCKIYNGYGYGVHLYGSELRGVDYNTIRDNLIYNNNGPGMILSSGTHNVAYNNIIYGNNGGIKIAYNAPDATGVYNNTIYGNTGWGIYIGGSATNTVARNNICWQTGDAIVDDSSGSVLDHNLTSSDPLFVDDPYDFHLTSRSPAIDTGVTLGVITHDYDGNARPDGVGNDIGAFEWGSSTRPSLIYLCILFR